MGPLMDLLLICGLTAGLVWVVYAIWKHHRSEVPPEIYRCACKQYKLGGRDEGYDTRDVYHGLNLCQPHREMIVGHKKPPPRR
jgi:hypothetical protein